MYINYNSNPYGSRVGDCVVRAISTAMNMEWEDAYINLAFKGLMIGDMPSSNYVWGSYLKDSGYVREVIPYTCPNCYTVRDFCKEHPRGTFILGTGTHTVAVIDGDYYDTWDSGDEVPIYYYRKERL